jgi:hypothetical protein
MEPPMKRYAWNALILLSLSACAHGLAPGNEVDAEPQTFLDRSVGEPQKNVVHPTTIPQSCGSLTIKEIFDDPSLSDGKEFCGEVVLVTRPYVGFYPDLASAHIDGEIALLPSASKRQIAQLIRIGTGHRVVVTGKLKLDRDCFSRNFVRAPISVPITLNNFKIVSWR